MGAGVIPIRVGIAETVTTAGNARAADVRDRSRVRNARDVIPRDRSRDSRLEMHACVNNRKQRISAEQTMYILPMEFFLWGEKTENTLPVDRLDGTLKIGGKIKTTKIR